MSDFYKLPNYWNLIILKNFYYFEIYILLFFWLFLYIFFKKYDIKNLIFIIFWVFLYKFLTISIFWNTNSEYINLYNPSISTINIFTWILLVAEVGLWIYLANYIIEKNKTNKKSLINKNNFFIITVLFSYILIVINEIIIRLLNLRFYNSELEKLLSWYNFLKIPLESYIYMLVTTILILWIYDYLEKIFKNKKIQETKESLIKYFYISFFWMLLLEILVHPIFQISWLPKITYIYQDINILLTIVWATWFSISIYFIDKIFSKFNFKITKIEYIMIILSILFVINLIVFSLLFNLWIINLTPIASSYIWGINILWLPIEVFSWIFITNIFVFMFIKSRLIK